MSPAARRYRVWFNDWDLFEGVFEARGRTEAIAKAQAFYATNGLGDFSFNCAGQGWEAEEVQS